MRPALLACLVATLLLIGLPSVAMSTSLAGAPAAPSAPSGPGLQLPSSLFGAMGSTCQRSSNSPSPSVGFPISIPAAGTGAAGSYNDSKLANNTAVNATITAPSNPSLSTNQFIVLGVGDPINATKFTAVAVAETFYLLATVAAPAAYLPNGTLIYNAANLVSLGSTHTYEINHVQGYWWSYTYDGNPITGSAGWENGTYNLGVSVAAGVMCEAGYTLGPSFVALAYGASGAATPSIPTTSVPWAVGVEPLGQSTTNYVPEATNAVPQLNATLGIVGVQGHDQVSSIGIDHLKVGTSVPYPGALAPLWGNYKVIILNTSTLTPSSATVAFGAKQDFNATAFDENGAWIAAAHYTWQMSPSSLGTLNTTTGTAVQFTSGSTPESGVLWANVSYNCSVIHDQANITVALVGAPAIDNFAATPPSLVVGDTTVFNVSAVWPIMSSITYAYTGLPGGCTTSNTSSLSCTPTAAGFFPVRVYVNDTNTHSSSQVLSPSLAVYPDLAVTGLSFTPNSLTWGTWTSVVTTAIGGVPPVYFDYQGGPTGCNGRQPATFNCAPKSNGTYQVVVFVNDSAGHTGTATASITVHIPIAISNFFYSQNPVTLGGSTYINITAGGGTPPYHYAYSSLPPGCTNSDTASLLCQPTAAGSYTPGVNVTDASGAWALGASPLTVNTPAPLVISSFQAAPNPVIVSQMTNLTVSATGGVGTYAYAYTGLPNGCTTASTPTLSCTPTQVATFNVTVTVTDGGGHSASDWLDLVVNPVGAPSISSFVASPSTVQLGSSTTIHVTATGGTGSLSYTYTGLPNGCSSTTPSFSCTPAVAGTFTLRVYVNDSASHTATTTTYLQVTPASGGGGLSITSFSALPSTVAVGSTTDLSVSASGGSGSLSYTYTGLPAGCTSQDLAALACTPSTAGTFTVRVYVNDTSGHSATSTTTITVTGPSNQNSSSGNSLGSLLPFLVIAIVAAVAVVGAVLFMRRKKQPPAAAPAPTTYPEEPPAAPSPAEGAGPES